MAGRSSPASRSCWRLPIAAIAALGFSVLFSWAVSAAGIPWPAPITHDGPTFFPVRAVAALLWAIFGYGARRAIARRA